MSSQIRLSLNNVSLAKNFFRKARSVVIPVYLLFLPPLSSYHKKSVAGSTAVVLPIGITCVDRFAGIALNRNPEHKGRNRKNNNNLGEKL